jgi:hypothetical protein
VHRTFGRGWWSLAQDYLQRVSLRGEPVPPSRDSIVSASTTVRCIFDELPTIVSTPLSISHLSNGPAAVGVELDGERTVAGFAG